MNLGIGLALVLLISLAGNAWLTNSRDDALTKVATLETDLRNARALEKQCSDSVDALEKEAKATKQANARAVAAAREESKGRQARGQETLSKGRSVPSDECASVEALFDDWYANRVK